MAPPSATNFTAEVVPQAPEDPLFGLMAAYRADQDPKKVDLVCIIVTATVPSMVDVERH